MSKIKFRIVITPPTPRNPLALDAMQRKAGKFKDRKDKRKTGRNWRHQDWLNE
jgi:hypothetical protein